MTIGFTFLRTCCCLISGLLFLTNWMAVTVTAAPTDEASLLDIHRPQVHESVRPEQPVVFIDSVTPTNTREKAPVLTDDFSKLPPVEGLGHLTFDVQPYIGQAIPVSFVAYAPVFTKQIQLLPEGDIIIHENFTLIQKTADEHLVRSQKLPTPQAQVTLIQATRNGQPVTFTRTQTEDTVTLTDDRPLSIGSNRYDITYQITNALTFDNTQAHLKLSLTGTQFNKAVEQLTGVVLMPTKTQIINPQMLFGTNDVRIPDAADIKTDTTGNLFFKLNQPLPAFADITLDMSFDASVLTAPDWDIILGQHIDWYFIGLWGSLLLLYAGGYLIYFKYRPEDAALKYLYAHSPFFIHTGLNKMKGMPAHTGITDLIQKLSALSQASIRSFRIKLGILSVVMKINPLQNIILNTGFFIRSMRQYIIAVLIFIGLGIGLADWLGLSLTGYQLITMGFIAALVLGTIYCWGAWPNDVRHIRGVMRLLTEADIAFGQTKPAFEKLITRLIPYIIATSTLKKWTPVIQDYETCQPVSALSERTSL